MKHLSLFATTAALSVGLSAVSATAATISFEELGAAPSSFAAAAPLTNQYASQGVNFSGGWEILDEDGNFGVDAISGDNFAAFNTTVPNINNTITIAFDSAISSIGGSLGFRSTSEWTITAFLDGSNAGGTVVSNAAGAYVDFSLVGSFNKVAISSNQFAGVLEDLEFSDIAVVPAPAALPMLALALCGFGIAARRRKTR